MIKDKQTSKTIMNSIFLILLFLAIIALFMATITIVKNKEMLQSRPIDYLVDQYDFASCSCTDKEGNVYVSSFGFDIIEITEVDN